MAIKDRIIGAGFAALRATGLHKLASGVTGGRGAILMFHHVRPWRPALPGFTPNRLLEITPQFLDAVIGLVRSLGFEIVTLDEALRRLEQPQGERFAALTFDDGYRDTRDYALPVLERRNAPFTLFVATGFAERRARLWWLELEEAVRRADRIEWRGAFLPAGAPEQKARAFATLYNDLRAGPEARLLEAIGALAARWGVDGAALVGDAGLGGTAGAEPVVVTDLSDCDEAPVSERSYPITKPAIATSATMPAIQTQVKGLFSAPKLRCGAVATSLESWRKSESRESVSRESV